MKKSLLLLLLILCIITLIACQSQNKEMALLDSVTSISISKSKGYGGLNENYFVSSNLTEDISSFKEVLKKAKATNEDMTNETPTHDILVRYENGETQGFHLVLRNNGEESIIMYVGHEDNGYTISPEGTKKLKNIIDVQ